MNAYQKQRAHPFFYTVVNSQFYKTRNLSAESLEDQVTMEMIRKGYAFVHHMGIAYRAAGIVNRDRLIKEFSGIFIDFLNHILDKTPLNYDSNGELIALSIKNNPMAVKSPKAKKATAKKTTKKVVSKGKGRK